MAWGKNNNWKWQLRDSKGRWIEMGRGVKWYSSKLGREVSGTVVGQKGKNAIVSLTSEPNDKKTGKPQQVSVQGSDIEVIANKASLDPTVGKMLGNTDDMLRQGQRQTSTPTQKATTPAPPAAKPAPEKTVESKLDDLEDITVRADNGEISGEDLKKELDDSKFDIAGSKGDYTVSVGQDENKEWNFLVSDKDGKGIENLPMGVDDTKDVAAKIDKAIADDGKEADVAKADTAEPDAADLNDAGLTEDEQKLSDGYTRMAERADAQGNYDASDRYNAQKAALAKTGEDRLKGEDKSSSDTKAALPEEAPKEEAKPAPEAAPEVPAETPEAPAEAPTAPEKEAPTSIGSVEIGGVNAERRLQTAAQKRESGGEDSGLVVTVGSNAVEINNAEEAKKTVDAAYNELERIKTQTTSSASKVALNRVTRDLLAVRSNIDDLEYQNERDSSATPDAFLGDYDINADRDISGLKKNTEDMDYVMDSNSSDFLQAAPIGSTITTLDEDKRDAFLPYVKVGDDEWAVSAGSGSRDWNTHSNSSMLETGVKTGFKFPESKNADYTPEEVTGIQTRIAEKKRADEAYTEDLNRRVEDQARAAKERADSDAAKKQAEKDAEAASPAPEAPSQPVDAPETPASSVDPLTEAGVTRTEPVALPGEKFAPTRQQQDIIDAVMAGKDTAVQALAGSGKTSTLEALARRIAEQNPDKKIVYVAFNRSVKLEAENRMPSNVEAKTQHGLAYGWAPKWMKDRSNDTKALRRADDVAGFLGIRETVRPASGGEPMSSKEQALAAMRTVDTFANSAETAPDASHMPEGMKERGPEIQAAVLDAAAKIWEDLQKPDGELKFSLDHMRKQWALTKPDLSKAGTGLIRPADIIFMDEAQDTPKVMAALMDHQTAQKVVVGDSNQNIYSSFTGSIDYMSQVQKDVELPLTKSWRFGPAVADIGNRFLQMGGSPNRVEGGGQSSVVQGMQDADAILVRSNAGMLGEILGELEKGRTVGVPSGTKKDMQSLINSAAFLKGQGDAPARMHDDLAAYRSWDEVIEGADAGDATLAKVANMVNQHGIGGLRNIMNQVVEKDPNNAFASMSLKDTSNPNVSVADGNTFKNNNTDYLKQAGFKLGEIPGAEPMKSGKRKGQPRLGWMATGSKEEREAMFQKASDLASGGTIDVTVSTAHKSKGLEWDKVKIGDDFRGPKLNEATDEIEMPSEEELRVAYVAVTRAAKEIDAGSLGYVFDYSDENGGTPKDTRTKTGENPTGDTNNEETISLPTSTSPDEDTNTDYEEEGIDDAANTVLAEDQRRILEEADREDQDTSAPDPAPEAETPAEQPTQAPEEAPAPEAEETPVPEAEQEPEPEPQDTVDTPEEVPAPEELPQKEKPSSGATSSDTEADPTDTGVQTDTSVPEESSPEVPENTGRRTQMSEWEDQLDALTEAIDDPKFKDAGDRITAAVQDMNGLQGVPTVVTDRAAFDALPGRRIFRGVSEKSQAERFMTGDNYVGTGGSGAGIYTSTNKSRAQGFERKDGGHLMEMVLSEDANVANGEELELERRKDLDQAIVDGNIAGQFLAEGDLGRYASARGFDGYTVPPIGPYDDNEEYVVLTDRGAVSVYAEPVDVGTPEDSDEKGSGDTEVSADAETLPDDTQEPTATEIPDSAGDAVDTNTDTTVPEKAPTGGQELPTPDQRPLHPVKVKAANYPDGTIIKGARTGESVEKTGGKWHVAGDTSKSVDPVDIDSPFVYDMPKQDMADFENFAGIDSVGPGDIIVTRKGTQAAVVGKRDGKLVVAAHNQSDAQREARPALALIDPATVKFVNKFDATTAAEPQAPKTPTTPKERTQTPFSGNRGKTNLSVKDTGGNEIRIGDTVRTAKGTGKVIKVRPSDGPTGSAYVEFADGSINIFRSNKMRNTAFAEVAGGDDPASMEMGTMGEAADGRAFMVGKDNKPVFKGDTVQLSDGTTGVVSGFAKGVQSINVRVEGRKSDIRKKASVVDAIEYNAPATTTSENDTTPASAPVGPDVGVIPETNPETTGPVV